MQSKIIGKIFLKFMVRAMVYGLKKFPEKFLEEVPGGGIAMDLYEEWQGAVEDVCGEQEKVSQEERIARLESAAGLSPQEARTVAGEVIVELQQQGQLISDEQANTVADLASIVPSLIRERTQATLRQARRRGTALHTVLPIGEGFDPAARRAFYQSLFPRRRPRFRVGEAIPHHLPAWHFVQLLGIGGFGEVWEVRHPHLPDHFAVKFCQDEISAKVLKREAEALIALCQKLPQHPNIARLLELQLEQEPYWLAFELVTGGTLEALLRTGKLSWTESLKVFRPLVVAMSAVHEVGIVHRDLKPANILLTADNVPKIADFGIGKVLADRTVEQRQTMTRFTLVGYGSEGYMSEEQMKGESAHPADDTFTLGVLLWQMLSGSLQPPPRRLYRLVSQLAVPQSVQELIIRCVDEPRSERPQNAKVLLAMLDQAVSSRKPTVVGRLRIWGQKVFNSPENHRESPIYQPTPPKPQPVVLSPPVAGTAFRDKLKEGSDGPEMIWIPSGKFMMGSKESSDEQPIHKVTIAYNFAMGKYPVTFDEYDRFCSATQREKPADQGWGRGKRPVINIYWQDAKDYCQWLSEQTGKSYRLPSEAEWEYACRAGTTTRFSFGDNDNDLQHYGWFDGNSDSKTHPVGEKKSNPWGLYDMHGNVWEWCEDVWHGDYKGAPTDGNAWLVGGEQGRRVLRGGCWGDLPYGVRAASRGRLNLTLRYSYLGVRVVGFAR